MQDLHPVRILSKKTQTEETIKFPNEETTYEKFYSIKTAIQISVKYSYIVLRLKGKKTILKV